MNEFTAKKLGEVLAFCQVGLETIGKGIDALESIYGKEGMTIMVTAIERQAKEIEEIAGGSEITLNKAQATGKKLGTMRDLYVGDEWDNPTELLEWSGFFEGAAIVHWELVMGSATGLGDHKLQTLASEAINFHKGLLSQSSEFLRTTGMARASK